MYLFLKNNIRSKIIAVSLILGLALIMVFPCFAGEKDTAAESNKETVISLEKEAAVLPTDIEIEYSTGKVAVGETIKLEVTVLPINAEDTTITYSSSDTTVASVNSQGEVKGISNGKAFIAVKAGNIEKQTEIEVYTGTKSISVSENFIVLKIGDTKKLDVSVSPAEADQGLSYKSLDAEVATVDEIGNITATGNGSTSIIVSNADSSAAVNVIVNTGTYVSFSGSGDFNTLTDENMSGNYVFSASETEVISSEILKEVYASGAGLIINGNGYTIELSGEDIVNFNNSLYTDIEIFKDEEGTHLIVNKCERLPGKITLNLDRTYGKYLYLLNEETKKYEKITIDDVNCLELSTAGEYLISDVEQGFGKVIKNVMLICGISGGGVLTACTLIKHKYWFW
ncbi:MAG: Ig domain-containing protein [Erysipelotrichaceae bacterium]|nr:Ig domain-containing protein [Lachnospiraceae bacterium]MBE6119426.1 Ig domain-containing protein [Erysipelotrichaceae bacterium]